MLIDLHSAIKKYNMNITGVIHVGGHVGTEYDEYQKIDTIEHMVFFEPDPDHFKKLKSRVSHDKRAICVNKALGPFSCEADFYRETANKGQSNSLLEPHIHTHIYPETVFNEKIKVKVHPLDKYQTSSKFNFINIDGPDLNYRILGHIKAYDMIRNQDHAKTYPEYHKILMDL